MPRREIGSNSKKRKGRQKKQIILKSKRKRRKNLRNSSNLQTSTILNLRKIYFTTEFIGLLTWTDPFTMPYT